LDAACPPVPEKIVAAGDGEIPKPETL